MRKQIGRRNKTMTNLDKWFIYTDHQLEMKDAIEKTILKVCGPTLNLNEFFLLYFLEQAEDKKLYQQDLQTKLHLSASAISRMIAKLEAKDCGVITKQTCSNDKRAADIILTPQGEETLKKVLQEVELFTRNI